MSAVMMNTTALFKTDATRRIDGVIDYFGEGRFSEEPPSAVRRSTWLTRGLSRPSLPAVFLEHPLAMDARRSQGA
jgi:hypothetical protein